MSNIRFEVRCCCDAGRLVGWIDLPAAEAIQAVRERRVALRVYDTPDDAVRARSLTGQATFAPDPHPVSTNHAPLVLPLEDYYDHARHENYMAVKSDHMEEQLPLVAAFSSVGFSASCRLRNNLPRASQDKWPMSVGFDINSKGYEARIGLPVNHVIRCTDPNCPHANGPAHHHGRMVTNELPIPLPDDMSFDGASSINLDEELAKRYRK